VMYGRAAYAFTFGIAMVAYVIAMI
jgi:hypothetical protein